MDNVQFEESKEINSIVANRPPKTSSVTNLFMKLGLAKDQKQANAAMVVISVICLALMGYFLMSTFFPDILNFNKQKNTEVPSDFQQRFNEMQAVN